MLFIQYILYFCRINFYSLHFLCNNRNFQNSKKNLKSFKMNSQTQLGKNESGADLFARLISQKNTQLSTTQNERNLTQIQSALMINKVLNLEPSFFPSGINNKEIVEIFGKIGLGKSELLMHFIARCLMPKKWIIDFNKIINTDNYSNENSLCVDLSKFSSHDQWEIPKVILIETESKFNMLRLYTILKQRLSKSLDECDLI